MGRNMHRAVPAVYDRSLWKNIISTEEEEKMCVMCVLLVITYIENRDGILKSKKLPLQIVVRSTKLKK